MFQVALGLLLLSVSASTSLAEERVRGSLDVLLCTPLSTRSILVGKWWGSFLQARHVLAWPAILAGTLAVQSGHWISFLATGVIAAYCGKHHQHGPGVRHLDEPIGTSGRADRLGVCGVLDRLDRSNSPARRASWFQ